MPKAVSGDGETGWACLEKAGVHGDRIWLNGDRDGEEKTQTGAGHFRECLGLASARPG